MLLHLKDWQNREHEIPPGAVVYIDDTVPVLRLKNLQGTADDPIQVVPTLGQSRVYLYGLHIEDSCEHIQVLGEKRIIIEAQDPLARHQHQNRQPLVTINGHGNALNETHIQTTSSTEGWKSDDWWWRARLGVKVMGTHNEVFGCTFLNVSVGVELHGKHCSADYNSVKHVCMDGMRALNHDCTLIGNTISHAHAGNPGNHLDGIQLWEDDAPTPQKGTLTNMVIEANNIYNPPGYSPMQGIGCFDGSLKNSSIRDNTVVVNHDHGITIASSIGNTLADNKVFNSDPDKPTWIMLETRKADHAASEGNIVIDNLMGKIVAHRDAFGEIRRNARPDDAYMAAVMYEMMEQTGVLA